MTQPPSGPGPSARGGPAALLRELIADPLDPGYAAAAARTGPRRRWLERPLLAAGCLLVGFTAALGYVQTHRAAPEATRVRAALVARVAQARADTAALSAQAAELTGQIDRLRSAALGASAPAGLASAELAAGARAVTGPGAQVELADPAAPAGGDAVVAGNVAGGGNGMAGGNGAAAPVTAPSLTDRDIRAVVNELWRDGAEAIAVNGIRLTPTSTIRVAGDAVLVDFQPIGSPYTIRAIGDPDLLITAFADSAVASRYQTLTALRGGGFHLTQVNRMTLPAGGPATLRYAAGGTR
ncbi:MAG: DUF881 domain-containing protein [Actinomycetia bacterium]|nr:DUF881 domain-containing protein [Actinomycetes bacterium]